MYPPSRLASCSCFKLWHRLLNGCLLTSQTPWHLEQLSIFKRSWLFFTQILFGFNYRSIFLADPLCNPLIAQVQKNTFLHNYNPEVSHRPWKGTIPKGKYFSNHHFSGAGAYILYKASQLDSSHKTHWEAPPARHPQASPSRLTASHLVSGKVSTGNLSSNPWGIPPFLRWVLRIRKYKWS